MKKLLCLLLALAFSIGLIGCNAPDAEDGTETDNHGSGSANNDVETDSVENSSIADSEKKNDYWAYGKDGETFLYNLSTEKHFQLTENIHLLDSKYAFAGLAGVTFSQNGEYVLYRDVIESGENGTVWGWFCHNLNDPDSKSIYIDSDIDIHARSGYYSKFFIINEATDIITYQNTEGNRLYQFNLKTQEKEIIADNVNELYVFDGGNRIILSNGSDLYVKNGNEEKKKIDTDIYDIIKVYESGEIYYSKLISTKSIDYVEDDVVGDSDYDSLREELKLFPAWQYKLYYYDGNKTIELPEVCYNYPLYSSDTIPSMICGFGEGNVKIKLSSIENECDLDNLVAKNDNITYYTINGVERISLDFSEVSVFDISSDDYVKYFDGETAYLCDHIYEEDAYDLYRFTISGDGKVENVELWGNNVSFAYDAQHANGKTSYVVKHINEDIGDIYKFSVSAENKVENIELVGNNLPSPYEFVYASEDKYIYYSDGSIVVNGAVIENNAYALSWVEDYVFYDEESDQLAYYVGGVPTSQVGGGLEGVPLYVYSNNEVKLICEKGAHPSFSENGDIIYFDGGKGTKDLSIYKDGKSKSIFDDVRRYFCLSDGTVFFVCYNGENDDNIYIYENGESKMLCEEVYSYYVKDNCDIFYIDNYNENTNTGDLYLYRDGESIMVATNAVATLPKN